MSESQQIESPDGEIVEQVDEIRETPDDIEAQPDGVEASTVVRQDGRKATMVPLPVLLEERRERQALAQQIGELQQQASRSAGQEQELAQLRAQIDALTPRQPAVPEIPDEEAEDTAKDLGLFTSEGKPDLAAAKRVLRRESSRLERLVDARVKAAVEPVEQLSQRQAADYLTRAAYTKASEGYCKPATLQSVLKTLPDAAKSNAEVMNLALVIARGIDGGNPAPAKQPDREVLFTEPSGGRRLAPGPLSDLEKRAAKAAGMKEEDWKKSTDTYTPGQSFRLE